MCQSFAVGSIVVFSSSSMGFTCLLLEWRAEQHIHRRWPRVPSHIALAEVAREVVVGSAWTRLDDAADIARKALFHLQPRISVDDRRYLVGGELLDAPAAPIEADAHRGQCDFVLLVQRDRRRRVQGNAVPDQLRTSFRHALLASKCASGIR